MANINLPNVRQQSTVRFNVSLKDNGVSVDWAGLSRITALIFSDSQKIVAGPCTAVVDPEDSENLIVTYTADKPQYLGIASVCIRCVYNGREKTYDKKSVNFVERTAQATGVTILDDPIVDVQLEVSEVSTSMLDDAIAAAFDAALKANEAAEHQPIIGANHHWWVWNTETGEYEDTDVIAEGVAAAANAAAAAALAAEKAALAVEKAAEAEAAAASIVDPLLVLAEHIASIEENLDSLKKAQAVFGILTGETIDVKNIPLICGNPLIIVQSGAPSVKPDFAGQLLVDTAGAKAYFANGYANTSDWKALN